MVDLDTGPTNEGRPPGRRGRHKGPVVGTGLVVVLLGAATWLAVRDGGQDLGLAVRRAEVAARGAQVMPFDQRRTTHVFRATPEGGVQSVTADDAADATQIRRIRAHLRLEATRFRAGDFGDPGAIHGSGMPGLAELSAAANRIHVDYSELPAGARLTFTTSDDALVAALHAWFDAQLMDHGEHAHG